MDSLEITLQPLTKASFAPYGDVIEVADTNTTYSINYGLTERHHALAQVDVEYSRDKAAINIFRSQAITLPFQIKVMERHPLGSQAFFPLSGNRYIVVVASEGELKKENIKAFLAQAHQGVNYHKGIWHHYNLALDHQGDFLVVDRIGKGNNCDEIYFEDNMCIQVCNT